MLTLAAARMCGYAGKNHHRLAATVEFIHTATLLHDDVVDESAQRRGRPTANLLWDNKSSVLVGDYLFARSFQLMVQTGNLRVLDILSNAAATIAEGEVLQLASARQLDVGEETYLKIVRGKTAALFSAAMEVGGIIAEQPEHVVKALYAYGDCLGIAFQIADDLLDYEGTEAIGKNLGDDLAEGKATLPLIYAMREGSDGERALVRKAILEGGLEDLQSVQRIIESTGALQYTAARAQEAADLAIGAVSGIPDSDYKDALIAIADFSVRRRS